MCDQDISDIPFPSGWAKNVRSAILHVISLAHYAITCARGWAANSINARVRLNAEPPRPGGRARYGRDRPPRTSDAMVPSPVVCTFRILRFRRIRAISRRASGG